MRSRSDDAPNPVSERMARQRTRDTEIEVRLRKELFARGLRYRLHVRPLPALRRTADIVFRTARVAVFVDGCFWHRCPDHGSKPKTNIGFWSDKLARNVERDRDTDRRLDEAGWLAVRVWEHEDPATAAERIATAVAARRAR